MLLDVVLAVALSATTLDTPPGSRGHLFASAVDTWQADRSHSAVSFRIRHFTSRVRARFDQWTGIVQVDPQEWASAQVDVTIQTASIDTQQQRRDAHPHSSDFFGAEGGGAVPGDDVEIEVAPELVTQPAASGTR